MDPGPGVPRRSLARRVTYIVFPGSGGGPPASPEEVASRLKKGPELLRGLDARLGP